MCDELPFVHFEIKFVEILAYPVNPARVADRDDGIGNVFRLEA
jgi:hypothetical protein